ncbi:lysophospholipase-like protein 1 isoform X5 [Desmodus rotundus]|uniref:lysophospholipase-like protein 1 isoform X5 n=1 Tax=Desmodus rotundus TaxID=9430 RepID=UPI0023815855|nr:lysophospholipase-like protein 1 isoform X5 [Desmodus rotundus]
MAAVSGPVRLQRCVVSPAGRHSASLIFLHGSGDSGQGLRNWIKQVLNQDLTFQHIKIIYPTAPPRPYTPMKGGISNVWFDRFKISNDCPEHLDSINAMCQVLTGLIDDEVRSGIKKSRILVGGFSMGGCMAMHLAYRNHRDVAGVFALSSFLNKASAVYQDCAQPTEPHWSGQNQNVFIAGGNSEITISHLWKRKPQEEEQLLRALALWPKHGNHLHVLQWRTGQSSGACTAWNPTQPQEKSLSHLPPEPEPFKGLCPGPCHPLSRTRGLRRADS